MNAFVLDCLRQSGNASVWAALRTALLYVPQYANPDYRDLGRFLQAAATAVSDPTIDAAAQAALHALDNAIVAITADHRGSSGLSIYLPAPGQATATQIGSYAGTESAFVGATGWDRFLTQFTAAAAAPSTPSLGWAGFNVTAALSYNLHALAGRGLTFDSLSLAPADSGEAGDPSQQTGQSWFRFSTDAERRRRRPGLHQQRFGGPASTQAVDPECQTACCRSWRDRPPARAGSA